MAKQGKAKARRRAKIDLTAKRAVSLKGGMAIAKPQPRMSVYKFHDLLVSSY